MPQINNRAAFEKDAHITRKEKDGVTRGESSGRREGKPKPKHRAKKLVECTKHKQEGRKEKTEIGEK